MERDWYTALFKECYTPSNYTGQPNKIKHNVFTHQNLKFAIHSLLSEIDLTTTLHYDWIFCNLFNNVTLRTPGLYLIIATSKTKYTWLKPSFIIDGEICMCSNWLRCWTEVRRPDVREINRIEEWIQSQVKTIHEKQQSLLSILSRHDLLLHIDIHKLIVDYTYGFTRIKS